MRTLMLTAVLIGAVFLSSGAEANAQLTVQQPVLQSTGGQFAVSVPDRGGMLLGSVSRAGESRSSYGFPFTRGSSVGRFTQHSSMSSHVWIQDLREMDRMILDMAESGPTGQQASTSAAARRAGLAWSDFQPRRGVSVVDRFPTSSRTSAGNYGQNHERSSFLPKASTTRQSRALDPAHSYRLGVEAEESGKLTLAKLHYEVAAQYGSDAAVRRLRDMTSPPLASK